MRTLARAKLDYQQDKNWKHTHKHTKTHTETEWIPIPKIGFGRVITMYHNNYVMQKLIDRLHVNNSMYKYTS